MPDIPEPVLAVDPRAVKRLCKLLLLEGYIDPDDGTVAAWPAGRQGIPLWVPAEQLCTTIVTNLAQLGLVADSTEPAEELNLEAGDAGLFNQPCVQMGGEESHSHRVITDEEWEGIMQPDAVTPAPDLTDEEWESFHATVTSARGGSSVSAEGLDRAAQWLYDVFSANERHWTEQSEPVTSFWLDMTRRFARELGVTVTEGDADDE